MKHKNSNETIVIKESQFGIFIVLPLRRGSLRQMMDDGLLTRRLKIEVLNTIKPIVCAKNYSHGDIKDSTVSRN